MKIATLSLVTALALGGSFSAQAQDNYSQIKSQLKRSMIGKFVNMPPRSAFKKNENQIMGVLNIPEDPRPARIAKATVRVEKMVFNGNSASHIPIMVKSILCERVIYLNVYEPEDKKFFNPSTGDFRKLECWDYVDGSKQGLPSKTVPITVGGYGLVLNKVESNSIIGKPMKGFAFDLFVGDVFRDSADPIKLQSSTLSFAGTADLKNQSLISSLEPSYGIVCYDHEDGLKPNPGPNPDQPPVGEQQVGSKKVFYDEGTPADPGPGRHCELEYPAVYSATIHVEDDQI